MTADGARGPGWWRAAKWSLITIAVLFALHWSCGLFAVRYVHKQLEVAAAAVCATVDPRSPPGIAVDVYTCSVIITNLTLLPAEGCSRASVRFQGHIDTLHASGLSLIGLLFRDRVALDEFQLRVGQARLTMDHDSLQGTSNDHQRKERGTWSVEIGSFGVVLRAMTVITQGRDTISTHGNGIEAEGNDLRFMIRQEDALASLRGENLHLSSDSLAGSMANGYDWSVGNCTFDQEHGTLDLLRTNIGPAFGLEAFSATLPYETDVIQARLDTLHIAGFDMNTAFAENAWSMRSIRLASGAVTVLRDKVAIDGNDPVKPLLSRVIRSFPIGSGADSITVHRLDVQYRERVDEHSRYEDNQKN